MKLAIGLLALASLAAAQPRGANWRSVWFEDGTALDFYTQSTGSTTPVSTEGGIVHSIFTGLHRVVLDKDGRLLFVYGVEAWRDALPQTFFVRIKPVDPDLEHNRKLEMPNLFSKATHPYPTVASVREFPGVRLGDAIVLDILQNPATGEKIFDVICPVETSAARAAAAGDEFNLAAARVVVNGQTMNVTGSAAASGAGMAIRLPAKGAYYLAADPSAKYTFRPAGRVEHDRMTIDFDGDRIEISGRGNLLKNSAYHTIWVYRESGQDRQYRSLERRIDQLKMGLTGLEGAYTDLHPAIGASRTAISLLEQKRDQLARTVTLEAAPSVDALLSKEK